MDLALPWELQSSSPSLWGRSRSHQDAESVPGREERPSLKFYRRGPGCRQSVGTASQGHWARGLQSGKPADDGALLALPQAFLVTKAIQSLLWVSVSLSTRCRAQTKEVLLQTQS